MTQTWDAAAVRPWLTPPTADDHKYARGVLGVVTGSAAYPGAAVIGVDAALHTGIGMVRWQGPDDVGRLVLARRPEVVIGDGRAQAWLVGSGIAADDRSGLVRVRDAIQSEAPAVLDAGALRLAGSTPGSAIITPHAGELAELLGIGRDAVEADPIPAAERFAAEAGVAVLLKGATTIVTDARRTVEVTEATPWLATAGAGDSLGGILGALLAARVARMPGVAITTDGLVALGATAAFLHGRAARLAAGCDADGRGGGPFPILDLHPQLSAVIRRLLADAE